MIETCTETNAYAGIVTTMIKNTRLQVGLGFLGGFGPFGPVVWVGVIEVWMEV